MAGLPPHYPNDELFMRFGESVTERLLREATQSALQQRDAMIRNGNRPEGLTVYAQAMLGNVPCEIRLVTGAGGQLTVETTYTTPPPPSPNQFTAVFPTITSGIRGEYVPVAPSYVSRDFLDNWERHEQEQRRFADQQRQAYQEARERAYGLLCTWLTPEQQEHLTLHDCLMIPSPSIPDLYYRIPADGGMVLVVYKGYGVTRLCLVAECEYIPASDMVLSLLLWATCHEEQYWRTAVNQGSAFMTIDQCGTVINDISITDDSVYWNACHAWHSWYPGQDIPAIPGDPYPNW